MTRLHRALRTLRHRIFGLPVNPVALAHDLDQGAIDNASTGAIEAAWLESAWRVPMVFDEGTH